MKKLSLLILLALCSCAHVSDTSWPSSIPPKSYFVKYYEQNVPRESTLSKQEYLTWVRRFYVGWELYNRGWEQTSNEFVATVPDSNSKAKASSQMATIGRLIAGEWAKSQRFRVINTRHLSIWGMAMNEAAAQQDQMTLLKHMQHDVEGLLSGTLQPDDIKDDRYYPVELVEDDMFD